MRLKFKITSIQIDKEVYGSSASGSFIIKAGDRNSNITIVMPWEKDLEAEYNLGQEIEVE